MFCLNKRRLINNSIIISILYLICINQALGQPQPSKLELQYNYQAAYTNYIQAQDNEQRASNALKQAQQIVDMDLKNLAKVKTRLAKEKSATLKAQQSLQHSADLLHQQSWY